MKKRKDQAISALISFHVNSCHSCLIILLVFIALFLTFDFSPRSCASALASSLWPAEIDSVAGVGTKVVTPAIREDAYRANNLGVALLEQYKHKEGAAAFTRALELDPQLNLARLNLSIALFNIPDLEAALREAKRASELMPDAPQPHYIIGLIARSQNRADDAIAAFRRVLERAQLRDHRCEINFSHEWTRMNTDEKKKRSSYLCTHQFPC
jgi:tetratricopeptide (TPR) repeat protein